MRDRSASSFPLSTTGRTSASAALLLAHFALELWHVLLDVVRTMPRAGSYRGRSPAARGPRTGALASAAPRQQPLAGLENEGLDLAATDSEDACDFLGETGRRVRTGQARRADRRQPLNIVDDLPQLLSAREQAGGTIDFGTVGDSPNRCQGSRGERGAPTGSGSRATRTATAAAHRCTHRGEAPRMPPRTSTAPRPRPTRGFPDAACRSEQRGTVPVVTPRRPSSSPDATRATSRWSLRPREAGVRGG